MMLLDDALRARLLLSNRRIRRTTRPQLVPRTPAHSSHGVRRLLRRSPPPRRQPDEHRLWFGRHSGWLQKLFTLYLR